MPFTVTWPSRIMVSAARREATPLAAITFCNRTIMDSNDLGKLHGQLRLFSYFVTVAVLTVILVFSCHSEQSEESLAQQPNAFKSRSFASLRMTDWTRRGEGMNSRLRWHVKAGEARHNQVEFGVSYSHSIVLGGLELMSYTTRFTPGTSLMIRFATCARKDCGNGAQSAVMPSTLVTARNPITCSYVR